NKLLPHHLHINMPSPIPDVDVPLIPSIPHLADGATILPRPGGTLALLAEAGRPETVVDTGVMNKLIAKLAEGTGGGGHTVNVAVTNPAPSGQQIGRDVMWAMRTAGV
ncbi:MAG TPA: hypothetical protein VIS06_16805, partial [Mycobacteriales bacterium]